MNALLLETWVGVSTFASTLWAATTVNAQQDLLYPRMREHVKVGRQSYPIKIYYLSDPIKYHVYMYISFVCMCVCAYVCVCECVRV